MESAKQNTRTTIEVPVLLDVIQRGANAPAADGGAQSAAPAGSSPHSDHSREELVEQVITALMPRLEALARRMLHKILDESENQTS